MKKYLFLFMTLMASSAINAIVVQRIYLKNGSVLNGYIEKQDVAGNYTVRTESATICLVNSRYATKLDSMQNSRFFKDVTINKINRSESELEDAWKKWAEKNNAYLETGDSIRTLVLHTLTIDGTPLGSPVRLLENGAKIKYQEMNENVHIIKWKDVEVIKGDMRGANELSGINRVYQTKDGRTFEGQFAEETDKTLGLYIDGMVETFDFKDVVKYTYKAINPDQDIFEQWPLLETVYTKNGSVTGLILEQNRSGKTNAENYILVRGLDNGFHSIKMSEYASTERRKNDKYAPKFDLILKEGQVLVNGIDTKKYAVKEQNEKLYIDSINSGITIMLEGSKLTVDYRVNDYGSAEAFQLTKINEETLKKGKKAYYISYKDLASSECHPTSVEKTPNCVKATYSISTLGKYALYDSRKHEVIILNIEFKK